eukprot:2753833-Rhodomonas_salina.1
MRRVEAQVVGLQQGQKDVQGDSGCSVPRSLHCEIKYKKLPFQYNLYQECGFLYLILRCKTLFLPGPSLWLRLYAAT